MRRALLIDSGKSLVRELEAASMARDLEFCHARSGAEARQILEREDVDILVVNLPADGSSALLLLELQVVCPELARIALSCVARRDLVVHASVFYQRLVFLPCPPHEILDAIERALVGEELLADVELRRVVGEVTQLPVRARSRGALEECLRSGASATRVSAIVSEDLGLAARVLHLINSSAYSLHHAVTDLELATRQFGPEALREIVASFPRARSTAKIPGLHLRDFSSERLQRDAVLVAGIASHVAVTLDAEELRAEAYAAGLFHDLGRLVLALHAPARYADLCLSADAAEQQAAVGAYLLFRWGFPLSIVEAVAQHVCSEAVAGEQAHCHSRVADFVQIALALLRDAKAAHGDVEVEALFARRGWSGYVSAWRAFVAAESAAWARGTHAPPQLQPNSVRSRARRRASTPTA